MSSHRHFDVVIVGGAMTGSILALALSHFSQHRLQIAIVEKFAPNYQQQGGFDARSIALAYGSLQKFAQIQTLAGQTVADLVAPLLCPIKQIEVSDLGHFGKTQMLASELKLPHLGGVVELAPFGGKLQMVLAKQPNIQLFCPDEVSQLDRQTDLCSLQLQSGKQLTAKLLVAADGINSSLAERCGVETELVCDYQQSAIIANVQIAGQHQHRAFERFTQQGPLALLPLNEQMVSLVWCVTDPAELLALTDEQFLAQLQQQFGWQLGQFVQVGKRFAYPLSSQKATSHIHHRLAIVGNAAQLLHPVAGQGFNLGLRDLFDLAQRVGKAYLAGQDVGAYSLLAQFDQARSHDQARIMSQTRGLISLFCNNTLPVQILRNAGLIALNHLPFARQFVAEQALGLH